MKTDRNKNTASFLYEIGTMRKITRMHRQALLTDDLSDNIASHSFRVALIAWIIAKEEGADLYKVLLMALLHDVGETRTNDHNWIHKRYVKVYEKEVLNDQFDHVPFSEFKECAEEYEGRETKEALIVKDADLLEQVLLLREYEWGGNREAGVWLRGKRGKKNEQIDMLTFDTSKKLGAEILHQNPSEWWSNVYTNANRS